MIRTYFDHERLEAYQAALDFVRWSHVLILRLPSSVAARGQLDRARTSAVLNLAEGNGKRTPADKCRFFDIAHGSALESAACLDVLAACDLVDASELENGKAKLRRVVSLLVGLIKSKDPERLREDGEKYECRNSSAERE